MVGLIGVISILVKAIGLSGVKLKPQTPPGQTLALEMLSGNHFGRYPTISVQQTWNMLNSDGWLVPYAGYALAKTITTSGFGRGIYSSIRLSSLIVVIDSGVYRLDKALEYAQVGTLSTSSGTVYIAENNIGQIAFCDLKTIYIYDYINNTFSQATTDGTTPITFRPGYITYQDGRFIAPDITDNNEALWYISDTSNGAIFPEDASTTGALSTKSDYVRACVPGPGKGNLLYVMGETVTELWYDVGANIFPYQRSTSQSIDFGCLQAATIATNENIVVWLSQNQTSGPTIVYTTGNDVVPLSDDGVNFKLSYLVSPEKSVGSFFRQDGHLIYQITFYDPEDNFTLAYDFTSKQFIYISDEHQDHFIARSIVFFNNTYYFVSLIDGRIYELSSKYQTYNYGSGNTYEIPRIRITNHIRLPDAQPFVPSLTTLTLEQGTDPNNYGDITYQPRIDISLSKNSGQSWSSFGSINIQPIGKFKNRVNLYNLGQANVLTFQFRFWGMDRFVVTNGTVSIY